MVKKKHVSTEQYENILETGHAAIRNGAFIVGREYEITDNNIRTMKVTCSQSEPYVLKSLNKLN